MKVILSTGKNFYLQSVRPYYNICPFAESRKGKTVSDETKAKHRAYAIKNNVRPPKETYEKRRKPVCKIDSISGDDIEVYESISDACLSVGRNHRFVSTISSVCNGVRKTAFGFKWKWLI